MNSPPRLLLGVLLTFVFLSVATGTMINVALPFIGEQFGVGEGTYGWVVSGYLLTFGVFSAVAGRLGDLFGVRRLYVAGAVASGIGALASALAPSIEVLIAVRVVQGAGAAAIPALGTTVIARLFATGARGAAMGAVIATVGVAASLSPFLGGALLQWTSWRVVFGVPALGLLVAPVAWRVLPASLDRGTAEGRFDVVGAALLGLAAGALLLATDLAEQGGLSAPTLGAGGVGLGLTVALAAWTRWWPDPFVPPALLREARYLATVAVGASCNAGRFGTLVLVPVLLKDVFQASPFAIGAALLPGAVVLTVLSPLAGRLADRLGTRRIVAPGAVGIVVTCLLTAWLVDHGVWGMAVAMTLFGAAFAFVQTPLLGGIGAVLPPARLGIGNGLYLMAFFLGGGFGVALSLTVLAAQPETAGAWLGLASAPAARFGNAAVVLAGLAGVALPAVLVLPPRAEA